MQGNKGGGKTPDEQPCEQVSHTVDTRVFYWEKTHYLQQAEHKNERYR